MTSPPLKLLQQEVLMSIHNKHFTEHYQKFFVPSDLQESIPEQYLGGWSDCQ